MPTLGGSGPAYLFTEVLGAPVATLPIANYDNNQHAANENLRVGNLWDGIEMYAGLLVRIGKEWGQRVIPEMGSRVKGRALKPQPLDPWPLALDPGGLSPAPPSPPERLSPRLPSTR